MHVLHLTGILLEANGQSEQENQVCGTHRSYSIVSSHCYSVIGLKTTCLNRIDCALGRSHGECF